jgi:hypothetical protein
MSEEIDKLAKESYYLNADIIRFLLIENLALKAVLHDRGLIDPEEYKKRQQDASQIVDEKVSSQIEEWKKAHPKVMEMFASANQGINQNSNPLQKEGDAVVV